MTRPSILCICGSPRTAGNTQALVDCFREGAVEAGAAVQVLRTFDMRIEPCRGCLRCNVLGRCAIKGDDWPAIANSFVEASGVLFASPVYFHHVTGTMKLAIDRFRSLLHVRMVEGGDGLEHSPRYRRHSAYGLILAHGARSDPGAREVRELIEFLAGFWEEPVPVETLVGAGLGLSGQVLMDAAELARAYEKLGLPADRAEEHAAANAALREEARAMGRRMAGRCNRPA